ncbi:MAG: hypothetical protein ACRDIV_16910 [Ktedonobacteraceae bacterium]
MHLPGYESIPRWMALLSCAIIFTVLLTACGGGGTSSSPTPTPTSAVKPSPTTPPTPTVSTTTYTGNGFSVGYQQGWQVIANKKGEVDFVDPTGNYALTVVYVADPNGVGGADTFMTAEFNAIKTQMKNPQTASVPSPVMVGGDSWLQKAMTGQVSVGGQDVPGQINILVDIHPAHSPPGRPCDPPGYAG